MKDAMVEFLMSGRFHDLTIGRDLNEVCNALGEPDYIISDGVLLSAEHEAENGAIVLYKYSALEVLFQNNILVGITVQLGTELPNGYDISDIWKDKDILDWVELMNKHSVVYEIASEKSYDDVLCLATDGVYIYCELLRRLVDNVRIFNPLKTY